jgi:uncharacterized protein YecT (DUF1311 family)
MVLRLLLCSILLAPVTRAQTAKRHYCATERTQLELNRCWLNEAELAGDRLKLALKDTMQQTVVRVQAEQAQAKWVEYRDMHCNTVAAIYKSGSMQPMQRAACIVRLTDQRIEELKTLLPESK